MLTPKKTYKLSIKDFIEQWNGKYPYDRWWRKKYNIPFGSKIHKETSHIDMAIEYKEDIYFKLLNDRKDFDELKTDKRSLISEIVALKQRNSNRAPSKEEVDKDFNDLNLSDFDDINNSEQNGS